ncbi:MAG TPA: hypothetical protein VNO55_14775, partial [Polyangia bacterium]|nr:hypothetical protein [Polyangia bacterium]
MLDRQAPRLEDLDTSKPLASWGQAADAPPPEAGIAANALSVIGKGIVANLADIAGGLRAFEQQLVSDPEASTFIERQRAALEESLHADYQDPKLQKIMSASLISMFGGNVDAKGNHIPSPGEVGYLNYFAYNTLNMVPSIALAYVPFKVAGSIALKLMSKLGVVTKVAEGLEGAGGLTKTASRVQTGAGMAG